MISPVDRKAQLFPLPSRATYKKLTAIHPKAPVAYVCRIFTSHGTLRTPAGPCHHFVFVFALVALLAF